MEKDSKKIIVPWDFSDVAEYALIHAERIARTVDKNIELLHIVEKKDQIQSKEVELIKVAEDAFKKYGIRPSVKIIEGSIFTAISNGSFLFGITGAMPITIHTANINANRKMRKNRITFFILFTL